MPYVDNAVIWKKKDKNGKTFLTFKASRDIKEGESLILFENDKGGVETRPDYKSYEKVQEDNLKSSREKLSRETVEDVTDSVPF